MSVNAWTGGFVATVRVSAGAAAVNGWRVGLTLPAGATITNAWNADRSATSGAVQFTNVAYNGSIPARRVHRVRLPGHRDQRADDTHLRLALTAAVTVRARSRSTSSPAGRRPGGRP
nr:hypothetical protein GCM10020092_066580 [Actinoplanes digitatis]